MDQTQKYEFCFWYLRAAGAICFFGICAPQNFFWYLRAAGAKIFLVSARRRRERNFFLVSARHRREFFLVFARHTCEIFFGICASQARIFFGICVPQAQVFFIYAPDYFIMLIQKIEQFLPRFFPEIYSKTDDFIIIK